MKTAGESAIVLCVNRTEMGMIRDALELMEDLEHLRPERQFAISEFLHRVEELMALHDFAAWEIR